VVPTPEDYTLTLHSDGTFAARADCNEASGTYISDEVAISLLVETTTTKECGPGSLGTEFLHLFSEVAAYRIAGTEMTFGLVDEAGGAAGEMTFSIAAA
jgi:heat shock protein HslJ